MRRERKAISESEALHALRTDLVVVPRSKPGQRAFKLVDQKREGGFEFELYELEYAVATSLDGVRCATDIVKVLAESGFTVSVKQVLSFYRELAGMGFIDKRSAPDAPPERPSGTDHSGDAIGFVRQGLAYLAENKIEFARQYYQAAIAIDPGNQPAKDGLVECDRLKAQRRVPTPLPIQRGGLPELGLDPLDLDDESATVLEPYADSVAGELDVAPIAPEPLVDQAPGYPAAVYPTPIPAAANPNYLTPVPAVYPQGYLTPVPAVYPTNYPTPVPSAAYPEGGSPGGYMPGMHAPPGPSSGPYPVHHPSGAYPAAHPSGPLLAAHPSGPYLSAPVPATAVGSRRKVIAIGVSICAVGAVIAVLLLAGGRNGDKPEGNAKLGSDAVPASSTLAAASKVKPATIESKPGPSSAAKPALGSDGEPVSHSDAVPTADRDAAGSDARSPAISTNPELANPIPESASVARPAAKIEAHIDRVEPRTGRLLAPIAGSVVGTPADGVRIGSGKVLFTIRHTAGPDRGGKAYQDASARVAELESLAKTDPDTYKAFLERARQNLARLGRPATTTREVRAPHSGKLESKTRRAATVRVGELLGVVRDDRSARATLAADPALAAVTPAWRCMLVDAKASCKVAIARAGEVTLELTNSSTPITSRAKVDLLPPR